MTDPVLFTTDNQVAVLTLNRPERRNAINQALLKQLYDRMEEIDRDEWLRVVIITGNGKSFCSGLDLDVLLTDNLFDPRGDGLDLPDIFRAFGKPVIGAINGHAITGGFEIALNCDFLIASENASFMDTHARIGIHPGWGMTQLLQQAVGRRRARQVSFTCAPVTARTAYEWGLVNEVVPHERLMARAGEIAGEICAANPGTLRVMQELIDSRDHMPLAEAFARERAGLVEFMRKHLER